MKVHLMGLDFTYYDQGEHEHVTVDMPLPPVKGTRIVFNGGGVYVVTHEPEFFINTGNVAWNDTEPDHAPNEGWIEACWVLVSRDHNPEEMLRHSADPREGMSDKDRERFDKQMAELIASIRTDLDATLYCPQCGRPCTTTTWRQDDCAPRDRSHCYKSHDQMNEIRATVKGC